MIISANLSSSIARLFLFLALSSVIAACGRAVEGLEGASNTNSLSEKPTISISQVDHDIRVGTLSAIKLDVSSEIDFNTHSLLLEIKSPSLGAALHEEIKTPRDFTRPVTFKVLVNRKPGDDYILSVVLLSHDGLEEKPASYSILHNNQSVSLLPSLVPFPEIAVANYDAQVTAGEYGIVQAKINNFDFSKYELVAQYRNDDFVAGTTLVTSNPSNLSAIDISVPIARNTPSGDHFRVHIFALEKIDRWNSPLSFSENPVNNQVTVLPSPVAPPIVTISNYDTLLPVGSDFHVDIHIDQEIDFAKYSVVVALKSDSLGNVYWKEHLSDPDFSKPYRIRIAPNKQPGSDYYILVMLYEKTHGYFSPDTMLFEQKAPLIALTNALNDIPQLTIESFDTSLVAGEYADVLVKYSNVDFDVYRIYVEYRNNTTSLGYSYVRSTASPDGTTTLHVPIRWSAPVGNDYYVGFYAVAKNGDWDNPITFGYSPSSNQKITVSAPKILPPAITLVDYDPVVIPGTFAKVNVSVDASFNFDTHELLVTYTNSVIGNVGQKIIQNASELNDAIQIPIRVDKYTTEGQYYIVLTARERNGASDSPLTLVVPYNNLDFTVAPPTALIPKLTINKYDLTITAGEYANTTVTYADVDFNVYDLYVQYRNAARIYSIGWIRNQPNVNDTLDVRVPVKWNLAPGNDYYFGFYAVAKNGGWNSPLTFGVEARNPAVTVLSPLVAVPELHTTNYDTQVEAGTFENVWLQVDPTIDFTTHRIRVEISSDEAGNAGYLIINAPRDFSQPVQVPIKIAKYSPYNHYIVLTLESVNGEQNNPRSFSIRQTNPPILLKEPSIPVPMLSIDNYDSSLSNGGSGQVTVTFSNVDFSIYKLYAEYRNSKEVVGATYITSYNSDSATVTLSVPIKSTAVAGNDYYVAFNAEALDGGWSNPRTFGVFQSSPAVSVTAP